MTLEAFAMFARGYDSATWFCANIGRQQVVGRIDMSGNVTYQDVFECDGITRNPDGDLYFVGRSPTGDQLGQIDHSGNITYVPIVPAEISPPGYWLVSGADGNLYTASRPGGGNVVRVTTSGALTVAVSDAVDWITAGPDGNLWYYVDSTFNGGPSPYIGRLNLQTQAITQYVVPSSTGLVGASDGGIWFDEGPAMGRIDATSGAITTYSIKDKVKVVQIIQIAPKLLLLMGEDQSVYQFNISTHSITKTWGIPNQQWDQYASELLGPDYNVWMPSGGDHSQGGGTGINVLVIRQLTTQPTSLSIALDGMAPLSAKETQYINGNFTAQSTNTTIAQVTVDSKSSFTISGIGIGSCDITVSDVNGNLVEVPVTVN
jgi:hypothetical protein